MRFLLQLAYDGTNYNGWQFQLDVPSIQETIETALSKLFNSKIGIVGCGRTDSGVHAKKYYAHFNTEKPPQENFLFKLNAVLPKDIVVYECFEITEDQHARFHATERTYKYYIHTRKDPFKRLYSFEQTHYHHDLDLMKEATKILLKYNDYEPLSKRNPELKHTLCNIYKAEWEQQDHQLIFTISANRFLHNMVRRIVGILLTIGRKKLDISTFEATLAEVGEFKLKPKAPAQGLYLVDVKYPFIEQ